jgi:Leucine-rich repeat (LRR) protein
VFGTIPTQIVQVTNLISFNLSLNLLTGSLPANIGLLRGLTLLRYTNNGLSNIIIPNSIGFISNLEHLEVGENSFIDSEEDDTFFNGLLPFNEWDVPLAMLAQLTNLITLDLSGMTFSESPEPLEKLTNLEVLTVAVSDLGNRYGFNWQGLSLLKVIPKLSSLREVDASYNNFVEELSGDLALATLLEVVDFRGNSLVGTIPNELGSLTRLSVLNFVGSEFVGIIPSEIFGLTNLNVLNLAGNAEASTSLLGSIPSSIGQMTSLKRLNLASTQISGSIPSEIEMTQLEDLNLTEIAVNGSMFSTIISHSSQLRRLDIHGTQVSGLFPELLAGGIEKLDFSSTLISGSIPSSIWSATSLTYLNMSNSGGIYGSIPSGTLSLARLETLSLVDVNL